MSSIVQRAKKPASRDPEAENNAVKAASTAPDSKPKKTLRGKREMFQVGFEPPLMEEMDAARSRLGLSRPAILKIALRRLLDSGI